jgi:hypothetical protein
VSVALLESRAGRRLWSLRDGCAALGGISRATAYKLNAAGKLRFVKVAGRTFIPDDELARVAREGTEPAT